MSKKLFAILLAAMLLSGCLAVSAAAVDTVATIGSQSYTTLQAAVDAYTDTSVAIQLLKDTNEAISISKDVYLDLNGFDVTGAVTVTNGTLYGMDSQTNDYTVEDDEGYGMLTNVTGNVSGVPVEAECAQDGYLMVTEGASTSFHRVNLQIYAMSLRATNVGLYYKSYFAGDEIVANNVESFGIALSVKDIPDSENLESDCECSSFTGFTAGRNDNNATSTLLKNVMSSTNEEHINQRNSEMPVYGRAYILTKGGSYVFGKTVARSLVKQVELAASDTQWAGYSDAQKNSVVSMYRNFTSIMRHWKVNNIASTVCLGTEGATTEDNTLKILVITSSFGKNTTQLFYDVAMAQGKYDDVIIGRLYGSGCTLEKHLKNAVEERSFYQYTRISSATGGKWEKVTNADENGKNGTTLRSLLDGENAEDWDIIYTQQSAAQSPQLNSYTDSNGQDYIDQLTAYVKEHMRNKDARFVWNMVWGYQSDSTVSPFPSIFNSDQMYMYQCNIDAVMKYVVPRTDFDWIIPTGTVIQNARTSYFGDKLCKDTYHLNNLGAVLAAYGMYAALTGEPLTEIKLDAQTATALNGIDRDTGSASAPSAIALTDADKLVIMESVNNALKNPFGVTESKYPPVDYTGYTYTENLSFFDNTAIAYCPACEGQVTWTEINQDNLDTLTKQGYFGATIPTGDYHFYLSSDVQYTGTSNSFLHVAASSRNVCLHLNGNDLTATGCAVATVAGNAKLNIMGTGIVSGNHTNTDKFRGSAIILNSGTSSNLGTIRLYSGTYIQPESNDQLAPISTAQQGGLLEIYEDATIIGNANSYSVCVNTSNGSGTSGNYVETVNIYGGTFNRPIYCNAFKATTSVTSLNIYGGNFADGIEIVGNTNATLSGAPVISGSGLKLADGITVTLDNLTAGASIAVDANGAFTVANALAVDYVKYFSAVQEDTSIAVQNNVLYCN